MTDERITYMHSRQLNAPQMNAAEGSNGQLLQILDACLIDGFNTQTVVSVTKTATSVTLTFGLPHGYAERQLIVISGATDALLNGRHRIVSLTEQSVTIDVAGVSVTTGTILAKVAPLEFESIFGNTNPLKRAYRSNNQLGTKTVLYLDMTVLSGYHATQPARRAMVSACENMIELGVQINSYTDAINNYASNPNGSLFWYQNRNVGKTAAVTSTTNQDWVVVGNGDFFYLFHEYSDDVRYQRQGFRDFHAFGDMSSFSGDYDRYNCYLSAYVNANDAGTVTIRSSFIGGKSGKDNLGFFIKAYDGVANLPPASISPMHTSSSVFTSGYGSANSIPYPNPSTNSLVTMPMYLFTANGLRAEAPALLFITQNLESNFSTFDRTIVDDLLLVGLHHGSSGAYVGFYAIDLGA